MNCQYCRAENVDGAVRCVECQRMLVSGVAEMGSRIEERNEDDEMLNSWRLAQERDKERKASWVHTYKHARELVLNAVVMSMIGLTCVLLFLYLLSVSNPAAVDWLAQPVINFFSEPVEQVVTPELF